MAVDKTDLMDTINEQAEDGWQVARTSVLRAQIFFVRGQDGAQPWTATQQCRRRTRAQGHRR